MSSLFFVDPWMRPPWTEEEIAAAHDIPATLYRGARYGPGSLKKGTPIFARPATVIGAYGEHGELWQMLIRAEDNAETHYFTRKHMPLVGPDFDKVKHSWFGSDSGWLCVIGERYIGPLKVEGPQADMFGGVNARIRAEEAEEAYEKAVERGRRPKVTA